MFTRRSFLEISRRRLRCECPRYRSAKAASSAYSQRREDVGDSPVKIAADEDFWREIQQAFTVDRSMINLNNGGVSPSPRVVQDAMRALSRSTRTKRRPSRCGRILEPRDRKRAPNGSPPAFGCDPEEMAITRNASEVARDLHLRARPQARRRSAHHQSGLSAHAHFLAATRTPRGHQAQHHLVSRFRRRHG